MLVLIKNDNIKVAAGELCRRNERMGACIKSGKVELDRRKRHIYNKMVTIFFVMLKCPFPKSATEIP